MLQAIGLYLAVDAVLSVITLGFGYCVFKKRRFMIRGMIRTWLNVPYECTHTCAPAAEDFHDEFDTEDSDCEIEDCDVCGSRST